MNLEKFSRLWTFIIELSSAKRFCKGPESNAILGFVGYIQPLSSLLNSCSRTKAVTDETYMNDYGCVPIKLYLGK